MNNLSLQYTYIERHKPSVEDDIVKFIICLALIYGVCNPYFDGKIQPVVLFVTDETYNLYYHPIVTHALLYDVNFLKVSNTRIPTMNDSRPLGPLQHFESVNKYAMTSKAM